MPDTLSRLLAHYPARSRPTAAPVALGNASGGSGAKLWRFDSGLGPLVARAWPPDGPGPAAIGRVHAWLARLDDLDFVPVPIACLDGRTLLAIDGRLWEVAPWKPGAADPNRPPGRARLRAAFAGLAAVHLRLAFATETAPSPGLIARLIEADGLLAGELARFEARIRRSPPDAAREPALRWVAAARGGLPDVVARLRREAPAPVAIQPAIRDARPEHFLFEGDRLAGLVDFGAMGVESPAADLARLLAEWVGPDRGALAEALDAYAAVRPMEPIEIGRIDAFAESAAWLGPARWVRWHYDEGRRFDDPDAVRRGLERGMARLVERVGHGLTS